LPTAQSSKKPQEENAAAKAIQQAFAVLNRGAAEEKGIEGELSEIVPYVLARARKLYKVARRDFDRGHFRSARLSAEAAAEIASIVDIVASPNIENAMKLPPPPNSPEKTRIRVQSKNKRPVHDSLATLDAYIFAKLKCDHSNEFTAHEMQRAYERLGKASKQIARLGR